MAKNLSPKCKMCRREGEKLLLKGERCFTQKCSITRRNYVPGMHGPSSSKNMSDYNIHLREKQKAKKIYGLLEKQFKNYFVKATKKEGVTGDLLLQLLEGRLDNVIFRLGVIKSRSGARQIVGHRHVEVNGRVANIPSLQVKVGDKISIKKNSLKKSYFSNLLKVKSTESAPSWLKKDVKGLKGEVVDLPKIDEIDSSINTQLIVEYYSK
ncbi:MAG: 30S ribosomal protein S4 [Parcubacteria group bacterium]|nr:30S ribosomal protein S4 [Parcubacteria group bacterium]